MNYGLSYVFISGPNTRYCELNVLIKCQDLQMFGLKLN